MHIFVDNVGDRKDRTPSNDDIADYRRAGVGFNETIRLMAEIDRVVVTHGGWPGAFASKTEAGAHT
ncbi:MAG: hypothetical protein Q8O52_11910 [Sulfuritalea sp.]|nr:hypothetical protein [Sulfuritalea sp.]